MHDDEVEVDDAIGLEPVRPLLAARRGLRAAVRQAHEPGERRPLEAGRGSRAR
jgi:hypothetical protein